uniref:WRKY domain-containing protein n=1 Tax=Oryza punctata TaxID=4537 RepID=A0A0E0L106_ORYPU
MTSSMAPALPPYAQVMEDMEKGQELAAQLQGLLRDSPEAGRIVDQILHTLSRAMRALDKAVSVAGGEGSEVQSEVTCGGGASSGGKRKASAGGGAGADRRANCRRRTQQSSGKTVVVKNLDDGQAWRKYGQKEIQNSKHPKAYFRCTHKYDQLCMAQRQVQRCDDDPASYRVTYIGEHTCRDLATAPIAAHVIHQVATGDDDDVGGGLHAGSRLISFVAAPARDAAAAAAPTTSTTNTVTAPGRLLQPLKVEGGVGSSDQEEVLSSLTPGSSGARGGGGGVGAGPFGPDQGDVTSSLHWSYDAIAGMEFFKDDEGVFDLLDDFLLG